MCRNENAGYTSFDTPARLVRQDEFREETGARTDDNDYSEPPHPEVTREDDDVSRPPSSPPSSPGEEPGRRDSSWESVGSWAVLRKRSWESACEDLSEDEADGETVSLTDLPDSWDLQRFQAVQRCTAEPPHNCEEFWNTRTVLENQLLKRWYEQSRDQLKKGEVLLLDTKCREDQYSFLCSLLSTVFEPEPVLDIRPTSQPPSEGPQ